MREAGAKPFEELSVAEARAAAWSFAALQGEPEEVASVEHTLHPRPDRRAARAHLHARGRRPVPRPRVLPRQRLGRAQHRRLRHDDARAGQQHRLQGRRGQLPEGARAPVPDPVRRLLGGDELGLRARRGAATRRGADRRDRRLRRRQPRRRGGAAGARRGRARARLPGADLPRRRARLGHRLRARERRGLSAPARVHALVLGPLLPDKSLVDDWRVSPLAATTTPACRRRSSPPPSSTRCATTAATITRSCTTRACP